MSSVIEQTLTVILRCFVYKIPPAKTVAGHNAQDWGLDNPLNKNTQLKVKVIEIGENCVIRVEETDTNQLFLETPYTKGSVDKVLDSSRYFVMRVVDPSRPNTHAFIGIGFQDRDEAFEFENALRTHDKYAQRQAEIERQQQEWAANHQDLSLKTGQTIQVSIKTDQSKPHQKREPRTTGGLAFNFATPNAASPSGGFFAPPPAASSPSSFSTPQTSSQPDWFSSLPMASSSTQHSTTPSGFDFFSTPSTSSPSPQSTSTEDWTDFSSSSSKNTANDTWANF